MTLRNREDLMALAGQYANERRAPATTIIKEILHYEILYALVQGGAAAHLTFQGGTALRLCYKGSRYSEDLDFAGGDAFDTKLMEPFAELLKREIGEAYGLQVDIKSPKPKSAEVDGVNVDRWSARVQIPQVDPSVPQSQVINIEVASVPAHDVDLVAVAANYRHLPAPHRQLVIVTESRKEILADKMVALGARPFLKARDIWDIKFLTDDKVEVDPELVAKKLVDYQWSEDEFKEKLEQKIEELGTAEAASSFQKEMSRFVDSGVAMQLGNAAVLQGYLRRAKDMAQTVLDSDLSPDSSLRRRR